MSKIDLIQELNKKIEDQKKIKYNLNPIDFEQHTLVDNHIKDFLWIIEELKNLSNEPKVVSNNECKEIVCKHENTEELNGLQHCLDCGGVRDLQ